MKHKTSPSYANDIDLHEDGVPNLISSDGDGEICADDPKAGLLQIGDGELFTASAEVQVSTTCFHRAHQDKGNQIRSTKYTKLRFVYFALIRGSLFVN